MKTRLLFPGTAVAIGVIAFAVGYRTSGPLRALTPKVEPAAANPAWVSADHASTVGNSKTFSQDNIRVEGFAKIGFAEMEEVLTRASLQDREKWALELGALPDSPLKPIALAAFYTAWLDLKPDEALPALRKFPDLLNRENVFDALQWAVSSALLPQLIDVISDLSEVERRDLLPSYLSELGQTDPTATARFIDSHPTLVSHSDAAALMSAWARDDIEAARKWLEGSRFLTEPDVLRSLVDSWFEKNPAAAQNYVVAHGDHEAMSEAAYSVAAQLFKTAPGQAVDFIRRLDDRGTSAVLMRLVSSASEDQVASLVTWVSTLPNSVTEGNLGYALARWSSLDPKQALAWLRDKPATDRDALVVQMVRYPVAPLAPEIVSLAYQIRDAQKREQTLSILANYLAGETGDATERIRALGLSASQTNHLLELRTPPSE